MTNRQYDKRVDIKHMWACDCNTETHKVMLNETVSGKEEMFTHEGGNV